MISMLRDWKGTVEVNGQSFENIQLAIAGFKPVNGQISIRLTPSQSFVSKFHETPVKTDDTTEKTANTAQVSDNTELRITVKKYMTEKSSPEFDFMAKWNNDNPMPMRVMEGTVVKETKGMVYMRLHGTALATITCSCCGKPLTNPVSRHYGIGPICLSKIGIAREIDDISNIKEDLVNLTWEGWVIKSAITEKEEV